MKTSFACGRRSASFATPRIAVGASNQSQIPPFQSTISSSGPMPAKRSWIGGSPERSGGSAGTPNGTTSITDRKLRSRS